MLGILTVAVLATLSVEEGTQVGDLLNVSGDLLVEQVAIIPEYSSKEEMTSIPEEGDNLEYNAEPCEDEVVAILETESLEAIPESSVGKIVAQETAETLQASKGEEKAPEKFSPCVEDLSAFLEQPTFTTSNVPEGELSAYERLPISVEDKQKINAILTTMADNNVFQLLFEKKRLERLGQEVNHVHPLRFLGAVFNDPRLVYCMFQIRNSGFKWNGFIDGLADRLKLEIRANNVNKYVLGFSESLDVRAEDVQTYVNYQDANGLVLFLMEKSRR